VQHRHEADSSTEMLAISCDRERGLGRGLEQQVVDHRLILIGNVADRGRQCIDHIKVRHRQQLGLAFERALDTGDHSRSATFSLTVGLIRDRKVPRPVQRFRVRGLKRSQRCAGHAVAALEHVQRLWPRSPPMPADPVHIQPAFGVHTMASSWPAISFSLDGRRILAPDRSSA
jgi:hypothetical protein